MKPNRTRSTLRLLLLLLAFLALPACIVDGCGRVVFPVHFGHGHGHHHHYRHCR